MFKNVKFLLLLLFGYLNDFSKSDDYLNSFNFRPPGGFGAKISSGVKTARSSLASSFGGGRKSLTELFTLGPFTRRTGYKEGRKTKPHKIQHEFSGSAEHQITYSGGCYETPKEPTYGKLHCSIYSGCSLTCEDGYSLPGDVAAIYIMCDGGKWIVQDSGSEIMPSCQPICSPPCQNQGICVKPDQCLCSEQYSGPQCQFENKPCLNLPPVPKNSRRHCRDQSCTISCSAGHQFPDGTAIVTVSCQSGQWVIGKKDWTSIPNCQATCTPPCQNGGVCLSYNVCQCPQLYRGPQCQYDVEICNSQKLNFNGGYKCKGDATTFTCTDLFCAEGMEISFEPAPSYTCKYSEGVFEPKNVPECKPLFPNMKVIQKNLSAHWSEMETWNSEKSLGYVIGKNINEKVGVNLQIKLPIAGMCISWGGMHYKTFDGIVYSFDSHCAHTLVRDSVDNTFGIIAENDQTCFLKDDDESCRRIIYFYIQNKKYKLNVTDEVPTLYHEEKLLPLPGQTTYLRTELTGHSVIVRMDLIGITLKWDTKNFIEIEVKEGMWNKTEGLCGNLNGNAVDDLKKPDGDDAKNIVAIAKSWQIDESYSQCSFIKKEVHPCLSDGVKGSRHSEATEFCTKLLSDKRFASCDTILDKKGLLEACTKDYCSCKSTDLKYCACDTMNAFITDCKYHGKIKIANWRKEDLCPMTCTGGKIYKSCGPKTQAVCGQTTTEIQTDTNNCEEGCFCPDGYVLHKNRCIELAQCPCKLRKKEFAPGSSVPKDCNSCVCDKGQWVCTQVSCGARCSAIGDPHYTTFDGKKFDFMGQCSYYLIKHDDFSIEGENVACPGTYSEAFNYPVNAQHGMPSCTKTATIQIGKNVTIKLRQNNDVLINGEELPKMPYEMIEFEIRKISSIFLQVSLWNGVNIWWDGTTRLYIDVPASFKSQTKGLCGTFNNNQDDDFLTPEGDVENMAVSFANKWKTKETCVNTAEKIATHPCDLRLHRRSDAEKLCSKLKSPNIFGECHFYVDVEPFYQDCLYDVCSCEGPLKKCLCPIIAAYGQECTQNNIFVDWRADINQCGLQCPGGQTYKTCGNPCTRTCYDIASRGTECRKMCVEGCNCPEGETLDEQGECVPINQCPCIYNGLEFQPGYKEVRPASKGLELCTCLNAQWSCVDATDDDKIQYPSALDFKTRCNSSENLEFTTCEPIEPKTCKNMGQYAPTSAAICHAGCQCKAGYVLDSVSKVCVKATECPCYHGGKSYKEGDYVQSDCNTCTCQGAKWDCTNRMCAAECSAWGDSHFKTFDGKHYDYQGQCDYVLSKGSLESDSYDIAIQNVPCSTLGTSCSKSVSIKVSSSNKTETVILDKDKKISSQKFVLLTIREVGLFVIVEAPELGLVVRWDKGTRVYVRLNPKWKGQVKGLCGNYNKDQNDDFQTPSGGMVEVSPNVFGDSWKLTPYCPEAVQVIDTCLSRPERKIWASRKCGILKSSLFEACHSEVPLDFYLEKCMFDTCACDQGGDCECLCTAIAAYAQECNNRGVPIHWRSQKLCPIQCEPKGDKSNKECSKYNPCISTCPVNHCDTLYDLGQTSSSCKEDTCVEGCQFESCPSGQIYYNSSYSHCVPVEDCKPVCMIVDDNKYYEGDVLEEDACHTCVCSRGKKSCKGLPCPTVKAGISRTLEINDLFEYKCVSGWSDWINQNEHSNVKSQRVEIEPLPTPRLMHKLTGGKCDYQNMIDIRCRTTKQHIFAKDTGLDAECSLESGLICRSNIKGKRCPDFEIQVLCECEKPTVTPGTELLTAITTTESFVCDENMPNREHYSDCTKFYECKNTENGPTYVQARCNESLLYNPSSRMCENPVIVYQVKPECEIKTTTPVIPTTTALCDKSTPNKKDREDCGKFFACENTKAGPKYIKTECAPSMLYNPLTKKCDYPEVVYELRPECQPTEVITEEVSTPIIPTSVAVCDETTPNKENFFNCSKYFACTNTEKGPLYVWALCEKNLLFNPESKQCESAEIVIQIKPECAPATPTTEIAITTTSLCDESTPDKEDPDNCKDYFTCINSDNGPTYVRKTCQEQLLYNPLTKICEDENVVFQVKAKCDTRCNVGYKWAECAFHCKDLCLMKEYMNDLKGHCKNSSAYCDSGCIPMDQEEIKSCPKGQLFNNDQSCVAKTDCMCHSINGHPVKPGAVNHETDCKVCQCVDNFYICDESACSSTSTEIVFESENTVTPREYIPSIITPPPTCTDDFIGLINMENLPDSIYHASSWKDDLTRPSEARYENKKSSWSPKNSSKSEYLEIQLPNQEAIYGIMIKGNPIKPEFVTSFLVMYSADGINFNTILDDSGNQRVFKGSFDQNTQVIHIFTSPFEAKTVKILPVTWEHTIALRVELLGCGILSTTSTPMVTQEVKPICVDSMSKNLHEKMITVSSSKDKDHDKLHLNMSANSFWQPLTNSPLEFVEFNFIEPRVVTGFKSKGGKSGWITAFVVRYSNDKKVWSTILHSDGTEKVFPGNYDATSEITAYFMKPVKAKYLQIVPKKWKNAVQLKLDILGCYIPYPLTMLMQLPQAIPQPHTITEPNKKGCKYCPGVTALEADACFCDSDLWYNGKSCVKRSLCPCVTEHDHKKYQIGSFFTKNDCSECVCKLGGIVHCTPKECQKCPEGLRSFVSSTCECLCQPCPKNQTLCPTNQVCIDSNLWCNDVMDCPDDEMECSGENEGNDSPLLIHEQAEVVCPVIVCPPNFKKVAKHPKSQYTSNRFKSNFKGGRQDSLSLFDAKAPSRKKNSYGTKGGVKGSTKNYKRFSRFASSSKIFKCQEYICKPKIAPPSYIRSVDECLEEECPPGFIKSEDKVIPSIKGHKHCPELHCIPIPPPDSICNITGRTFTTFDGTNYKYDICVNMIARDLKDDKWQILLTKNCSTVCSRNLEIRFDDSSFVLYPDLSVEFDGFIYQISVLNRMAKYTDEFSITKVGNVILFTSPKYGFWLEWNTKGDVKIGVVPSLAGKVDGMCGFFDYKMSNDKMQPDGNLAKTSEEFGDSWSASTEENTPDMCKINACPQERQDKAWQLCNTIRDEYFAGCSNVLNINASISKCMDSVCECLEHSKRETTKTKSKQTVYNVNKCMCNLLETFAVDCLSENSEIEISDWRRRYDCPSDCPAPLVPNDCFQRDCEPTCESLGDKSLCKRMDKVCYPGCYCPPELVRQGDKCIKPSECRDCECKITPTLDIITYDESNFTLNGNCVYVLSRDLISDRNQKHGFQVLITNGPCAYSYSKQKMCLQKVTVLVNDHEITMVDGNDGKIKIVVDSEVLEDYSDFDDWLQVKDIRGQELNVMFTKVQLEIVIKYLTWTMSVKAPSYKYGGKLEGLCGDCNRNPYDDFREPNRTYADDANELGLSWLYEDLPGGQTREQCEVKKKPKCKPLPDHLNPCYIFKDEKIFGKCAGVVNPQFYEDWCNRDVCEGQAADGCKILQVYADECTNTGYCVDWFNDLCPKTNCTEDKVFKACGNSCAQTCDSVLSKEKKCVGQQLPGCYCPDDQVIINGVCADQTQCILCDAEGHHPGEKWKKDKCTTCLCDEFGAVKCTTRECPTLEHICEKGYKPEIVPSKTEKCCPKYTCVLELTASPRTCPPAQLVTCGPGKRTKIDTKADGCPQYICECLPLDECPEIDTNITLPEGFEQEIDNSDCCPVSKAVCRPELCNDPPKCVDFYKLKIETPAGSCCPKYKCEPPKNKCIFESEYTAGYNGGEMLRNKGDRPRFLKNAHETWNDGPCRNCKCTTTFQEDYKPLCTLTNCPDIEDSSDFDNYILKKETIYNQCCPKFEKIACRSSSNQTYQIGEEWTEGADFCTIHKCDKVGDEIVKEISVTKCDTECRLGFEYEQPGKEDKKCCGFCKPVGCVVEDIIKRPGDEWISDDFCTKYKCLFLNQSMQVKGVQISCPSIPQEKMNNYVIKQTKQDGECCNKTEMIACKSATNEIYHEGEQWTLNDNYCENFLCAKNDYDELEIKKSLTTCEKDCPLSYRYVPAEPHEKKCCGQCVQIGCLVNNTVKMLGEKWESEDHCIKYTCENVTGSIQVQNTKEQCHIPSADMEAEFLFKATYVEGKCCKEYKKVACKVADKIFEIGTSWPSPDGDLCKKITCMKNADEDLQKQDSIQSCKKSCDKPGYEYVPSSTECCGKCVEVACVVDDNGTLKQPNEGWQSLDGCTNFTCAKENNRLMVIAHKESCPNLIDCPVENIYQDGCCEQCNKTEKSTCKIRHLPSDATVKLIKTENLIHGLCVNLKPANITECVGNCDSSTIFDPKLGHSESLCTCCQAVEHQNIQVDMECEDGFIWQKNIKVPSRCSCNGCTSTNPIMEMYQNSRTSQVKSAEIKN